MQVTRFTYLVFLAIVVRDEHFDIDAHVSYSLQPVSGLHMKDWTAAEMSKQLTADRPLWDIHLVQLDTGQSAVLFRVRGLLSAGCFSVFLLAF